MYDGKDDVVEDKVLKKIFTEKHKSLFDSIDVFPCNEKIELYEVPNTDFVKGAAAAISDIMGRVSKGLIISYSFELRGIAEALKDKGKNLDNLRFVDAISYASGKGTPPIKNTRSLANATNFSNLFYYSLIELRAMNFCPLFIIIINPHNLLIHTNMNEIGVFFRLFMDKFQDKGIPTIFIYDSIGDVLLKKILRRLIERSRIRNQEKMFKKN